MDECWEWEGDRSSGGYGRTADGRTASRVAYIEAYGPIGHDEVVRHRCDNPPCVRPSHLVAGMLADNTADMWRQGRAGLQNPGREPVTVRGQQMRRQREADPEYRERLKEQDRERKRREYADPVRRAARLERQRQRYANDPEARARQIAAVARRRSQPPA